ncbi:MAG: GNAT family N-acetyltransferase [Gemmataceae bacterium]|nr:GNAT family N-acetyltransferase [Gemmataceae bacterium]
MDDWRIEPLADHHERGEFSCGKPPLDVFLRTQAGQYGRKGVGRTFVAVAPADPRLIGYYTLAASSVPFADVPADLGKKLPRHPVPALLIGRLAVDVTAQGRGLGSDLLMDAERRALGIAEQAGVVAVHVHAIDDEAIAWYVKYGFRPLLDQGRHLYLPMETIRKGLGG